MISRRQFLRLGLAAGAGLVVRCKTDASPGGGQFGGTLQAEEAPASAGLSDPALQPKFVNLVPDALAPTFKFPSKKGKYKVAT